MNESADELQQHDEPEGVEDLETAYRMALEAIESAETEVGLAFQQLGDGDEAESDDEAVPDDESASTRPTAGTTEVADPPTAIAGSIADPNRPSPIGIVEAALFVGGTALTHKKLGRLLNDEFDAETVSGFVERLNARYAEQRRPYEIAFGEGGYRMQLKSEYDDVRNRVFGLGPREIKLSQPALEVLSLVAYRQPIEHTTVAEHAGKSGLANLRQLVRRELVEVERDEGEPSIVRYRTTDRFLQVFGLADLDELPRAVELELK